ncbi:MAG: S49 family peptidase, partial [Desulfovibrionaceae bacterium]|nr:S49 family peptidase [Desulfovibrionaceae bacterium]
MNEILWALQPDAVSGVFACWHELEQPRADMPEAAPHEAALGYSISQGVAVIRVDGPLDRQAHFGWLSGQRLATGYDEIAHALDAACANPQVRAILLSFNSPGGAVPGCKELADHIAAVGTVKPCAAYADGLCASAAFWLASATGTIYAPRTATVGSIGVVMVHVDTSRAWDRAGVAFSYITGGKFKAVGNPHAPLSEDDRAYLQQHAQAL